MTARPRMDGYYWVRVNTPARRHQTVMGRFISEPWVGITPWRVEGEWFAEAEVRVLSARLEPPAEEPAA